MRVLNFGSLNIDYVYWLDHIVAPGETITSSKLEVYPGGKGLNQSIALAKAGVKVYHAGLVGPDGEMLRDICLEYGVDISYIKTVEERTGNAIIQVSRDGGNSIVLFSGANRKISREFVEEVLSSFGEGDLILLQNEINQLEYIMECAYQKRMTIALNPSPFDERMLDCDLGKVDIFLLNEIEGAQLAGIKKAEPHDMLENLHQRFPKARIVLTLGEKGVAYRDQYTSCSHGVYRVPVVDTTAAGDTFTGFFISALLQKRSAEEALETASKASAIAISRPGAATSIPDMEEVRSLL